MSILQIAKAGLAFEDCLLLVSPGPYILFFQRALKAKQEKRPNQILKLSSGISQDWEYYFGDPSTKGIFWGLYWCPLISGNYHISKPESPSVQSLVVEASSNISIFLRSSASLLLSVIVMLVTGIMFVGFEDVLGKGTYGMSLFRVRDVFIIDIT